MNCYVLYKTVKIFFFCQGPRRTADLLLSGPGSEMFGVLPDWASLQDQANLTLAIRINNIQHSSRFLSVLSCHCRFHFDFYFIKHLHVFLPFIILYHVQHFTWTSITGSWSLFNGWQFFLLKMIPTVISFAFKAKNCKIFLHSNMLSFWNVVTCILSKCRCW